MDCTDKNRRGNMPLRNTADWSAAASTDLPMPRKYLLTFAPALTVFALFTPAGCANTTPDSTPGKTMYFDVNIPSQPDRKFSAYMFKSGVLKGAILSNSITDKTGKLRATFKKVDGNNCLTGEDYIPDAGLYNFHYRLDTDGTSTFVYPTVCGGQKGFLRNALSGGSFTLAISGPISFPLTEVSALPFVQFSLSIAGFNAVTIRSLCSLLDGETNPSSVTDTATMGLVQDFLTYTGGGANFSLSGVNAVAAVGAPMRYACWVDADNNGSYNTGDYIASGFLNAPSMNVTSWATVP
jgi:hypothetical protein